MKKNIVMLMICFAMQMHAMEKENQWSITVYGTKINLTKDSYDKRQVNVDVMVVGYNKSAGSRNICSISRRNDKGEDDILLAPMPRDDDGLQLFSLSSTVSNVFSIAEPWVAHCSVYINGQYSDETIRYCYEKKGKLVEEDCIQRVEFYADMALQEASKDLSFCYEIVLKEGLERLGNKEEKSIGLLALSADLNLVSHDQVGFPREKAAPIAAASILEFIKNNIGAYNCIELFVEQNCGFDLYKELLMQWRGKENVLLLYFAQKDSEHLLSSLPCELISYIANLI